MTLRVQGEKIWRMPMEQTYFKNLDRYGGRDMISGV